MFAGPRLVRVALISLMGILIASALMVSSVHFNLQRACVIKDTPYLDICSSDVDRAFDEKAALLKQRIARSPGDSRAYVELAFMYARNPDKVSAEQGAGTLEAAVELAPHDPDVLRMQVNRLTRTGKWAAAIPLLVELAEFHVDFNAATLLATWASQDVRVSRALVSYVKPDSQWLARVLDSFGRAGLPIAKGIPLVSEGIAKGLVTQKMLAPVMQRLKADGKWADAYGLWMQQNGGTVPALYNPGFDQPLRSDGFDWELNVGAGQRPGATAQRMRLSERGYVLGVQYSGRSLAAPVVKQQLFLYEGRYRLDGQYMAEKLRSEKGLAWVARCQSTDADLGRSSPLGDTRGNWVSFGFDITVPKNCLGVVTLQLETEAPYEAGTGFTGRAYFDGFAMARTAAANGVASANESVR